jgi:ABC-2 type transport system ATP-binding protein
VSSAIQTEGLTKRFDKQVVLDGIDLDIPAGSVFALLGPNGAGKTTAVHILSTLLRPDAGVARVGGHDVVREAAAVRSLIGVTGQFSAVDNMLTGEENLQLMARLRHLSRADGRRRVSELLERFDLTEAARKPLATYSGGMRRRLDLAMTLVDRPQIVFLDEPTTGLDPRSRAEMWQIVRELVAAGTTILLTTQYLEEADQLASRIAVLDQGHIVADDTPSELKRLVPGGRIRLEFGDADELDAAASAFGDGTRDDQALALDVPSTGDLAALRAVMDRVDREHLTARALTVHTPDLEDVFFALTGRRGPEEPAKELAGTQKKELES